jgi:hypothetical protein
VPLGESSIEKSRLLPRNHASTCFLAAAVVRSLRTREAPRSLPRRAPFSPNAVAATAPAGSTARQKLPIGVLNCVK